MSAEQSNVNFNDSGALFNGDSSNIPDRHNRVKKSRSRSRWGNKRPVAFGASTSTLHFGAPIPTTPKERAPYLFMQKIITNHTTVTDQYKNAVEVHLSLSLPCLKFLNNVAKNFFTNLITCRLILTWPRLKHPAFCTRREVGQKTSIL